MRSCFFKASRVLAVRLALVALALAACPLKAAVQLTDVSAAPAQVGYTDREIQIPQFDPSLGTLQYITIDLQGTGSFSDRFTYFGRTPGQLIVHQNLRLTLETSDDHTLVDVNQVENHAFSFSGAGAGASFAGPFGDSHFYAVTAAGTRTLDSQRDLRRFSGSGFIDLFLDAQGGMRDHFTRGGGVLEGLVLAGADITVSYNYIPASPVVAVPEVGTWPAGGIVLLGLALIRLRRQPWNR